MAFARELLWYEEDDHAGIPQEYIDESRGVGLRDDQQNHGHCH